MAKRSANPTGGARPLPPDPTRMPGSARGGRWSLPAVLAAVLLGVYVAVAYLVLPDELPALVQRGLGLVCAALAVAVFALATSPRESTDQFLHRMRHAQHADFGRQLRMLRAQQRRTVNLPLVGETSLRLLGGIGVFAAVGAWWLTPWAPVGVERASIEGLTALLGEELVAPVLVLPDGRIPVAQVPVPPPAARQLAGLIREDAGSYEAGLKAIAEGRPADARSALAAAMREETVPAFQIHLARAQNEMYAGQFANAAQWYRDALQSRPDDPMLWCQLAAVLMHAGQFDKAEPPLAEAARLCEEKPTDKDAASGVLAHLQALLMLGRGSQIAEAESLCLKARNILKQAPPDHPVRTASLNNQAVMYMLEGRYPGAEELFQGARHLWSRGATPQDPLAATATVNLAMLRGALGKYAEAEALLQRAGTSLREQFPANHPVLVGIVGAEATLHLAMARYDQARKAAENALTLVEKVFGPNHPAVAPLAGMVAAVYTEQSRYRKAEPYQFRASSVVKRIWGPEHPFLAVDLDRQVNLGLAQGRLDPLEALCEQARQIAERAFGKSHPEVAAALYNRGRLEIARDQLRAARPYLEEALRIREAAFGREHPDIARTLGSLAALERSPRTYPHGVAQYKRALAMAEQFLGPEHPEVARLLFGLAALQLAQNEYGEARPVLDRCLAVREKALPPFHLDLAATLDAYAGLLLAATPPEPQRAAELAARAKTVRARHDEEDRAE